MFHEFPYTSFSEMNLDWLVCMCKKNEGLHLAIVGDTLRLLNANNEVISNVTISYAEKALTDTDGRPIKSYIISAGVAGDTLVFTSGDQVINTITVPYSEKSKYDIYNNEITDYVLNVQPVGNKIRVTNGDTTVTEFDCPFSLKAVADEDGNNIKTYACDLTIDGQNVQLRDRAGRVLSAITVPFAVNAGTAAEAVHALDADDALHADEADHADDADSADYALLSTDATNAIETIVISGDQVIFTTYGGTQTTITSPFSVKAQKDDIGNVIKTTYVAGVSTNAGTGEIYFLDALGNTIASITPQVEIAKKDTYNNLIADYIKTIITDSHSNYMTVTHGTGTTESILINYATKALNDLNDQAIHNTYISYMECVEDVDDGHYKLVCYDGDTPKAELFRFEVYAYAAQTDVNGKDLTSYVADIDINGYTMTVKDGEANTLETLTLPKEPVYVIKCSDSVDETSWTDWQAGGYTLPTPTLYKDGVVSTAWSELTSTSNVSFELTADNTNFHTFKLSEVNENPGYGSSSFQFEYIGTEAGSLPDSFAYIVRLGFFDGNLTTKKGYRVPLIAQGGASTLDSLTDVSAPYPQADDILQYDGYVWQSVPGLVTNISSPSNGQVLTYDGTSWVNQTPGGGGSSTNIYTISTSFSNLSGSMQSITLDDATLTAAQLRTNMDAGVVRIKDSQGSEVTLLGYNTNGIFFGAGMDIGGSTIRLKMQSSWGTNWDGQVTSL